MSKWLNKKAEVSPNTRGLVEKALLEFGDMIYELGPRGEYSVVDSPESIDPLLTFIKGEFNKHLKSTKQLWLEDLQRRRN